MENTQINDQANLYLNLYVDGASFYFPASPLGEETPIQEILEEFLEESLLIFTDAYGKAVSLNLDAAKVVTLEKTYGYPKLFGDF